MIPCYVAFLPFTLALYVYKIKSDILTNCNYLIINYKDLFDQIFKYKRLIECNKKNLILFE